MRDGVGRVACLLGVLVLAAPVRAEADSAAANPGAKPPAAGQASGNVHAFDAFCDIWMQKLQDRAAFNRGRIEWKNEGDTVVGEHVTYGKDRVCVTRSDPGKEPIGKITYREVRYRRRGPTPDEALAAPGTVVERFDVTEIFRFADGRWQY